MMAFVSTSLFIGTSSLGNSLFKKQRQTNLNRYTCNVLWRMTTSNGNESSSEKSNLSDRKTPKKESVQKDPQKEAQKAPETKAAASSKPAAVSDSSKTVAPKSPADKAKETVEQKKTVSNKPKWSKALPFMLWPQNLDGKSIHLLTRAKID